MKISYTHKLHHFGLDSRLFFGSIWNQTINAFAFCSELNKIMVTISFHMFNRRLDFCDCNLTVCCSVKIYDFTCMVFFSLNFCVIFKPNTEILNPIWKVAKLKTLQHTELKRHTQAIHVALRRLDDDTGAMRGLATNKPKMHNHNFFFFVRFVLV